MLPTAASLIGPHSASNALDNPSRFMRSSEAPIGFTTPPLELLDLPSDCLEEIATRCNAKSLAALFEVNDAFKEIVARVLHRNWTATRRHSEVIDVALHNDATTLRFLAQQNLCIDDIRYEGQSLLAASLEYALSRDTYTALLDMTANVSDHVIDGLIKSMPLSTTLLQAAIFYRNSEAVSAVLDCERHALPAQRHDWPGYVVAAADNGDLKTLKCLLASGKFSVNERRLGRTALMAQLTDSIDADIKVFSFLLSRDDIELNDPQLLNTIFEKHPRRLKVLVDDPRVDVNAPGKFIPQFYAVHTPLTMAMMTGMLLSSVSNFDVLLSCNRLDVCKPILSADHLWRTPEQFIDYYAECSDWSDPHGVKGYMIRGLRNHPSYSKA